MKRKDINNNARFFERAWFTWGPLMAHSTLYGISLMMRRI